MNPISSISFCGGETAGSISKLAPSGNEQTANPSLRGSGSETAGSVSKLNYSDSVFFRGAGGETAGSVSKINNPADCSNCAGVNFQGYEYAEEKKKGMSNLGVIGTITAVAAAAVIGLAYGHKKEVFSKLGEGNILRKLEPVAETCHKWCSTAKTKSVEYWDKFKNFFKGKKD